MLRRVLLFIIGLCLIHSLSFAAAFDPKLSWKTVNTDHFSLHYSEDLAPLIPKVIEYLESAYADLSKKYRWKPLGRIQTVFSDTTDDPNGSATVLPYDWLFLRAVPPGPESSLSYYDDWLKLLIYHELTHIMHLDAARGFWRPFRLLVGKTASPAGLQPAWIREGIAVYEETVFTAGGRARAPYTEMLLRTAILQNQFPTIDRAAGVHWSWPSGQIPYHFGAAFFQYLVDRYGVDAVMHFHFRVQGSPWLGAINHQAKKTIGKSFYQLWKEWQEVLRKKYEAQKTELEKRGLTPLEMVLADADFIGLPTFSANGKYLAYVKDSLKKGGGIWLKDLETGRTWRASKRMASQLAFDRDGTKLYFTITASHKRYYRFFDLYRLDVGSGKSVRLTKGERVRDPDVGPDGKQLVLVRASPLGDTLVIYHVESKQWKKVAKAVEPYGQFATPRFSPDGKSIAVAEFLPGVGWEMMIYSANGKQKTAVTKNGLPIEMRPTWSPDGKSLYFVSDVSGIPNVHRWDVASHKTTQITNVLTGVGHPAISHDGKELWVRYYNGKGFDVRKMSLHATGDSRIGLEKDAVHFGSSQNVRSSLGNFGTDSRSLKSPPGRFSQANSSIPVDAKGYSSLRRPLLLPQYLVPGYLVIDDAFLLSLATGSTDPLLRHRWNAGGTYRTDAARIGFFANYAYSRWRPLFGFGVNDYYVDYGGNFFERRLGGHLYGSVPWGAQSLMLSYSYENRDTLSGITPNEGRFGGLTMTYSYGTLTEFPASISPEKGRRLRLSATVYDRLLASVEKNEKQIVYGDWREFIGLGGNHVLALRTSVGYSWGDFIFPRTFTFGGSLGEGTLVGPASTRSFPLRGLLTPHFSGDHAALAVAEYRLPLASPERGLGTWPVFLNDLHLAFFGDYGNIWNSHFSFDDFLLGIGSELRIDLVVGHGLPLNGRLGYAVIVMNRDRVAGTDNLLGQSIKNGILIMQWGTSF